MVLDLIVRTFWLMFPAYAVNSAAVFVGGGTPMDLGKKAKDGERYLGDGKTWRGFFGGTFVGVLIGLAQNWIALQLPENGYVVPFARDYPYATYVIALLCFGSMTGDAIGSYIKRRMKIPRGGKANIMDPLGFVLMAWLFVGIGSTMWFYDYMLKDIVPIITMLVLTPLIHRLTNILGYKMGKKKVPW
jgi:CDP-2,3-bis-(O-geranylgeranyl)-sn-glycerol synthase